MNLFSFQTHHLRDGRPTDVDVQQSNLFALVGRQPVGQERAERALPHAALPGEHHNDVLHAAQPLPQLRRLGRVRRGGAGGAELLVGASLTGGGPTRLGAAGSRAVLRPRPLCHLGSCRSDRTSRARLTPPPRQDALRCSIPSRSPWWQ